LRPEKYPREKPESFLWSPSLWGIPASYTLLEENTLGEFVIQQYFQQRLSLEQSRQSAEGWAGDRFAVYEKEKHRLFVWKTKWDTVKDREEFIETYLDWIRKRYPESEAVDTLRGSLEFRTLRGYIVLYSEGREVLLVEGLNEEQRKQWSP
jgi:hypothetical protein